MIYNLYVQRDSLLHSLDPRVKIIGAFLGIVAVVTFNSPYLLGALFLMLIAGLRLLGRITLGEQWRVLKPLLPLMIITAAIWPFILKPPLFGLLFGAGYAFRLGSMALITFSLLLTTKQKELVLGFIKLGMPYEIGLTLTIALRYIPTLYILATNIMDAQKARGLELEKGNFLQRARKTVPILVPLIVSSIKTAHELAIALESRGFGAGKKRTLLHDIEMKGRDYAALAVLMAGFAVLMFLRYRYGLGHVELRF
ncbi:energy-coupling factor transporter transmembrane component T family protein [Palaeococcus ferrophilus]|uniref:energy-coupling factor transporter transmembrane component T family protein n=1 Tax=Palaeococcus ferrophilus TaxID=83868 RepID=UPI00064F17C2|nr:energy-coupling factor transporter transmembrane component T [Palaeococcus ferrophilus]